MVDQSAPAPAADSSTIATPPPAAGDPRFPKFQVTAPPLPLGTLDNAANAILDPNAGKMTYFGYAVVLARMTFFAIYLTARKLLIDQMLLAAKQQYEQAQGAQDQAAIGGDNLDEVKKP